MKFTLSVRSFHVPLHPGHLRLPSQFAFGTDFTRHARNFAREPVELVDHCVDGVFEF